MKMILEPKKNLVYKDISLNLNTRVFKRGNIEARLPHKEYILLKELLENSNIILSKSYLLEQVCAVYALVDTTRIEAHVCNLRKKVDRDFQEKLIQTIPCAGYMLS